MMKVKGFNSQPQWGWKEAVVKGTFGGCTRTPYLIYWRNSIFSLESCTNHHSRHLVPRRYCDVLRGHIQSYILYMLAQGRRQEEAHRGSKWTTQFPNLLAIVNWS